MGQSIAFYHNLYIVCGFLGLAGLIVTVIIYYYFDMGKIIRDMLGITKKLAIREMEDSHNRFLYNQRKQLEALANDFKTRKGSGGEQTGDTGDSGSSATRRVEPPRLKFKIQKAEEKDIKKNQEHLERKEALAENANAAVPFDGDAPTDILEHVGLQDGEAATELLPRTEQERAEAMNAAVPEAFGEQEEQPQGITAVLYKEESQEEYIPKGDTMVLNAMMLEEDEEADANPTEEKKRKILFILEKQILLTHTDEVIEA